MQLVVGKPLFDLGLISVSLWLGFPGLQTLLPGDQRRESGKQGPGELLGLGVASVRYFCICQHHLMRSPQFPLFDRHSSVPSVRQALCQEEEMLKQMSLLCPQEPTSLMAEAALKTSFWRPFI